ncbi:Regulatory protein RecX [Candidatus Sumerlaea chitinivorans]|uniref:Regulatory protein RecX n=1 Tax=Sumerlaea chitinivorans TaxID=2250252 RepID=A0A2Z4Y2C8_SUMC1|nr:Regulatory protein RecX [Candidatus Sumerlaea chitinivorans]
MVITGFKAGKRKSDPFTVELSTGDTFQLDAELIVRFQLKKGMELNTDFRQRLEEEQATLLARRRLVRYLSGRRKTKKEAEEYLRRLGFKDRAVAAAIQGATELGLLNDESYAIAYRRTQERISAKGYRAIEHELIARGVAPSVARKAIADATSREYQLQLANQLAEKRRRALADLDPMKGRQRLSNFLLRRGFDAEVVSEVVRKFYGDSEND